jgi:glycolate oxidase
VYGHGDSAITRSFNERNCMAVEWVLPNGDLVNLGSPATPGAGWFSGDGPGPSMIGLMRGTLGHMGESGVFTKAATKLYPWYGPPELETGGMAPWFDMKDWPLCKMLCAKWDDYDDEVEALYLIGEADIFDSHGKLSTTKLEVLFAEDKNEWARIRKSGLFQELYPHGVYEGVVIARTRKQLDYCVKAFERIVSDTNGTMVVLEEDPMPEGVNNPERWRWRVFNSLLQAQLIKNFTPKICFMPSTGTMPPLPYLSTTSVDKTYEILKQVSFPHKKRYQEAGHILDDGPDGTWNILNEGGHFMMQMNFTRVEPMDPNHNLPGFTEASGIHAAAEGFEIIDFIPDIEKFVDLKPYMFKLNDMVDPNALSSGFMFNLFKLVIDKGRYDD